MTRNEKAEPHIRKVSSLTERELQSFLERNPSVIPAGVKLSPVVCIGRNVQTDYGYIECLFISPTGGITAVVTDMSAEQVIACTGMLRERGIAMLNEIAADYTFNARGQASYVLDIMAARGYLSYSDDVELSAMTNASLQSGSLLLIAVGEEIKAEADALYEYLKKSRSPAFNVVFVDN